jgi:hypothetical protein
MLHKETVDPITLKLIRDLQNEQYLKSFLLVGGTSLSLHIGHRKSIDIDLFSNNDFDAQLISEYLEEKYDFSEQYLHIGTEEQKVPEKVTEKLSKNQQLLINLIKQDSYVKRSRRKRPGELVNRISH